MLKALDTSELLRPQPELPVVKILHSTSIKLNMECSRYVMSGYSLNQCQLYQLSLTFLPARCLLSLCHQAMDLVLGEISKSPDSPPDSP